MNASGTEKVKQRLSARFTFLISADSRLTGSDGSYTRRRELIDRTQSGSVYEFSVPIRDLGHCLLYLSSSSLKSRKQTEQRQNYSAYMAEVAIHRSHMWFET